MLARLLVPRDFGLIALGMVVVVLGGFLAEAGFGAALIQRKEEPTRLELEAMLGLQLLLTGAVAAVFAAAAAPFGDDALVMATMAASLPIRVVRMPTAIVLERTLRYRPIATADVVEALVFYIWAIGAVALGMGVWGVATATVVRALAGTATVLRLGPLGVIAPRASWRRLRPLLGFGAKFQATFMLQLAREQGLNLVVAAVGGLATLGVWNLAWRVLQVPNLVFQAVARVSFPVMSRLLEAGEDPRRIIERGVAMLAAVTGILVVALVAIAPALPSLVGAGWSDVPAVLLWSGIALIISAPITVATTGYLLAAEDAGAVATITLATVVVWFGVAVALLPKHGAPAVAVGWLAAGILNAVLLARRTSTRTGAAVAARAGPPTAVALSAALAGWQLAHAVDDRVLGALLGLVAAEVIVVGGLAAVSRPALRDTHSLARQAALGLWRDR